MTVCVYHRTPKHTPVACFRDETDARVFMMMDGRPGLVTGPYKAKSRRGLKKKRARKGRR